MKRVLAVAVVVAVVALGAPSLSAQLVQVRSTVETEPVPNSGDAADDAVIWIHPTDPSLSTVIGTDKDGGLAVYDLAGRELQYDASVEPNNVDLRYDFPLGGTTVTLVGFSDQRNGSIGAHMVDPATGQVVDVVARPLKPSFNVYGFCMYRSPVSGKYYAFVTSSGGSVEQWELFDDGTGKVDGTLVRSFSVGSESEGCVADDVYADIYIGEENVGIWKYGAEPGDGTARTMVDSVGAGGHITTADVEGLAIYYTSDGGGYLIASSQGSNQFVIYDRLTNAYVGTFEIVDGTIDGVTGTDGIDVTNFSLGPAFPEGLFVAQDGNNSGANQNFKYVPWGAIAGAFTPSLTIDTAWDPRGMGGGGGGNRPPSVDAGPDQTIELSQAAVLDGTVSDDGLPEPASLTLSWSQTSSPGTADFADPAAADTSASFSDLGTYVLRLTASDGELEAFDEVTVAVVDPATSAVAESRVSAKADDAEERDDGSVALGSGDLELVFDQALSSEQTVGIRFAGLDVPQGALITDAWVQFQVEEATSDPTHLTVRAEAADDGLPFASTDLSISSRPTTASAVAWQPEAWPVVGAGGDEQRLPALAQVVQEVVDRPGWQAGNALVLVITGAGRRTAEAYDGLPAGAPLLHVEYAAGGSPGGDNRPPSVDAGADLTVELSQAAVLDGTVSDDGLPEPASLTLSWSQASGPAPVAFGAPAQVDTTVAFQATGTYVLRLTASDGEAVSSDDVTITVVDALAPQVAEVPVGADTDDAEERANGTVALRSGDLELVFDQGGDQTVGIRFADVPVPPGALITNAWVQFTVDEVNTVATSLEIRAQADDDAPTFTSALRSISTRPTYQDSVVTWQPPPWTVIGQAGPDQRTPGLAELVQGFVDRPGWLQNNALALIITGDGERTAGSFDGTVGAPVLHVEYVVAGPMVNLPPVVDAGPDATVELASGAVLDGTVTDDGLPEPLTTAWSQVTGPAPVAFGDPAQVDTTVAFQATGTYVLRLTASDGEAVLSDDVTITVVDALAPQVAEVPVGADTDDAEERADGTVALRSGDLELVFDQGGDQTVGIRFADVPVPPGALITNAWVQFTVDEENTVATSLEIRAQDDDDAPTFTSVNDSISTRPRTQAFVNWQPPAWTVIGQAGLDQRTPGLAELVQEVVDRLGWERGNALALLVTGTGERTARSFDGLVGAPVLHVEYLVVAPARIIGPGPI